MEPKPPPDELRFRRERKFLETLRDNPFVAVVEEGGELRVYTKSAAPALVASIEALLDEHSA